ncbi:MAG: glycoside hydrolase family 15 protein [Candidatus Dormibacteraeota bacterium]|nr:glycoside hydrolase family 15 protein [Candidatus Dormibacteraeota bacterium]
MLDPDPPFRPIRRREGYLHIEDLSLIGDGTTCALVGVDGSICWMCVPSFDSEPLWCSLLDRRHGGHFTISPEDVVEARQRYELDTGVLITELRCPTGMVRVTDALALHAGADIADDVGSDRAELVRSAVVVDGSVRLRVEVEPRGGGEAQAGFGGLELRATRRPDLHLHLRSNRDLAGLRSVHDLRQGERLDLLLSWGRSRRHHALDAEALLRATADSWRRWMRGFRYSGPEMPLVRRAAITLKLLDSWLWGSTVAAATSSLPAPIGGVRNWDYRYTWLRDASFAVFALRRTGFVEEADGFLGWVLDAFEQVGSPLTRIMYTLQGHQVPDEWEDPELEGYQCSAPVRWGNGAADQRQHDVYGEILDCADQWCRSGGRIEPHLWQGLSTLADAAKTAWRQPDQGIWEVRSEGRVFTYSAAMCQVALDRAVALAQRLGYPGPIETWRAEANNLREMILDRAWDERTQTLSASLDGSGELDANLLALPLRRVLKADHPRMVATTKAVAERLSAGGGLLYRYLHTESPDGIAGDEGAFLLCSFWLVDNLAMQGRVEEAAELYSSLCSRASPTGLLSEQIKPSTGEFMGNFPQAFSHIGVIFSGVTLATAGWRS